MADLGTSGSQDGEGRVEALARKLLRSPSENGLDPGDLDSAMKVARRRLEDSDARQNDPATRDPEHDSVIRRTSGETSSIGDTMSKRSYSGD